jgi:hypothetical protein
MSLFCKQFQNATVDNYCVAYECSSNKWRVGVELCLCFGQSYIEEINKEAGQLDLQRCCNETLLTKPEKPKKGGDVMKCPSNVDPTRKESLICDDVHTSFTQFTVTNESINIPKSIMQKAIEIPRAEKRYCLGPTFNTWDSFNNPLSMTLFFCPKPCNGVTPCIRLVIQVKIKTLARVM